MDIQSISFYSLDLDQLTTTNHQMDENQIKLIENLLAIIQEDSRLKPYQIKSEETLVVKNIQNVLTDDISAFQAIASHLLECERMAQAKIYSTATKVKQGSLIQALVKLDETMYQYIIAKVEHTQWIDGNDLSSRIGFSFDKRSLWKSAIFTLHRIDDQWIFDTVHVYTDTKAKYWIVSFLEVEEKRDDAINTYKAFKALDMELKSSVSKHDYVCLSDSLQQTIQEGKPVQYEEVVDSLMDAYTPSDPDIEKEVIKDCLMALPERKKFDTDFTAIPSSIQNKRTKKFKVGPGVYLQIQSDATGFTKRIQSTMANGKRVIQIICDDDDTYDAFVD